MILLALQVVIKELGLFRLCIHIIGKTMKIIVGNINQNIIITYAISKSRTMMVKTFIYRQNKPLTKATSKKNFVTISNIFACLN